MKRSQIILNLSSG